MSKNISDTGDGIKHSASTLRRRAAVRVVVADADEDSVALTSRLLRSRGIDVFVAGRGLEALTLVQTKMPNLSIVDSNLSELHGFDIVKKLRNNDSYRRMPVIFTSARYRGWRIAEDLRDTLGVQCFLEKPCRLNVLWGAVQNALNPLRADTERERSRMAGAAYRLFRDAVACDSAGDTQKAVGLVQEAIRCDPFSAKLRYELGVLYRRHKRAMVYSAIDAFEDALSLAPRYFPAMQALGVLYEREGFPVKAAGMWERALYCCPSEETAQRIRAHLLKLL